MYRRFLKSDGGHQGDQALRLHAGQVLLVLLLRLAVLPPRAKTAATSSLGSLVLLAGHCFTRCFYHIFGAPLRSNAHVSGNRRNAGAAAGGAGNRPGSNPNQISISIIPTSGLLPSHRKMLVIASQPTIAHMTPVVA